jgi:hypothetical protein
LGYSLPCFLLPAYQDKVQERTGIDEVADPSLEEIDVAIWLRGMCRLKEKGSDGALRVLEKREEMDINNSEDVSVSYEPRQTLHTGTNKK